MKNRIHSFTSLNKIALKIAAGSFILGTLLFLVALITANDTVYITGFIYLLMVFLTNLIVIIAVVLHFAFGKNYKENSFTLYCLMINIPIAIAYLIILDL